jgi:hypothetical protein
MVSCTRFDKALLKIEASSMNTVYLYFFITCFLGSLLFTSLIGLIIKSTPLNDSIFQKHPITTVILLSLGISILITGFALLSNQGASYYVR